MKKAFTMIEIVFVIIVLGVLASIAMPIFNINHKDAQITKARVELATIRSEIALKRSESFLISGKSDIDLDAILKDAEVSTKYNTSSDYLLRWSVSVDRKNLKVDIKNNGTATFSDDGSGKFETCTSSTDLCSKLDSKL
ncbi:type II secretion system protein [Campylobacter fetus]|uniref:type II secretion system protein n=1 Tax=Campylobacter fetus TaxID=196 RepID=UPI000FCB2468|nr:type II secretion system protein [Campylobacter fetus]QQF51669.1 type II secretion system protein [Campylobacter fetus subsp. venerealis]RUT51240.1 prepilin-type N-terminal cleavage/methylation domain-containing protein [Campylobacter fetus]RUT51967.1 prepilin-type N-terminal cleavage/methylation domain-containing protein [Campylobacter fetus]